jgi:hypothetical protein
MEVPPWPWRRVEEELSPLTPLAETRRTTREGAERGGAEAGAEDHSALWPVTAQTARDSPEADQSAIATASVVDLDRIDEARVLDQRRHRR